MQHCKKGKVTFYYPKHLGETRDHIHVDPNAWCELAEQPSGEKVFRQFAFENSTPLEFPIYKGCSIDEKSIFGGLVYIGDPDDETTHFEFFFFEGEIYTLQWCAWNCLHRFRSNDPRKDWKLLTKMLSNTSGGGM